MISPALYSSRTEDWGTPQDLFDALNDEFYFTLDPCSTHENAKCKKHYTKEEDGLAQDWDDERVFCNPPYGSAIGKWVKKCATSNAKVVVMLIPARTDTAWFHEWIYTRAEIRFIRGRLKFAGAKHNAPFPSMICIFRRVES